jgi:hypothetical protein
MIMDAIVNLRLLSCLPRLENSKYLKCLLKRETFGPYSSLGINGVDYAFHPPKLHPETIRNFMACIRVKR